MPCCNVSLQHTDRQARLSSHLQGRVHAVADSVCLQRVSGCCEGPLPKAINKRRATRALRIFERGQEHHCSPPLAIQLSSFLAVGGHSRLGAERQGHARLACAACRWYVEMRQAAGRALSHDHSAVSTSLGSRSSPSTVELLRCIHENLTVGLCPFTSGTLSMHKRCLECPPCLHVQRAKGSRSLFIAFLIETQPWK